MKLSMWLASLILLLNVQCNSALSEDPPLEISASPEKIHHGDVVTIKAEVSDSQKIKFINLYIDEEPVHTCSNSTTCNYSDSTFDIGNHSFFATASADSIEINSIQSEVASFQIKPVLPASYDGQVIKIMPLGDSITEASGYRLPLWNMLTDQGFNIDYVGSKSKEHPDLPDQDHEGHSGWNIGGISKHIDEWLPKYQPDIILLMIGTNDTAWWSVRDATEIADDHAELVDQILQNIPPDIWLVVATIPPQSSKVVQKVNIDRAELTQDFNSALKSNMQLRMRNGKNVVVADMEKELSVNDLLPDGIHPTSEGYKKIASVWFNALQPILNQKFDY